MNTYRTARPIEKTLWGSTFTLPAGTLCHLVKGASGTEGDLFAVSNARMLMDLTGNRHDPLYRYCFVPTDAVEGD